MENLFKKNPLQDLLSSLNAVISTNESTQIITGHVIYNPAYTYKFQLKTTEDTLLPMLPEKLHRTVYLFLDLLREVIDVLLAFKAFGQRPDAREKAFTPMAVPQEKAFKNECICRCDCCDCCPC